MARQLQTRRVMRMSRKEPTTRSFRRISASGSSGEQRGEQHRVLQGEVALRVEVQGRIRLHRLHCC